MPNKIKKPFIQSLSFKIILLLVFFIPPYSQIRYNPVNTTDVITSVLANPIIEKINFLLPMAKLLLLLATLTVLTNKLVCQH